MTWVTHDFVCETCGAVFEELYQRGEPVECLVCGSQDLQKQLCAPNLAAFSMASQERKSEILRTRSEKHTAREVAREPEKWGQAGIARQQTQKNTQVGYTGGKK